ncbi:MAG TPA: ATP-grasp domain-containing protein [Anaeromyxobacter sp.]
MDIGVLVTGVGPGSTGEQVYKALRFGRRRYRITVANMDLERAVVAPGARRIALPPASDAGYLDALADAANAVGARFLVPGSDVELVRVAAGREALGRRTPAIPLVNDLAVITLCSDKGESAAAVSRAGLRAPRTLDCASVEAVLAGAARDGLRFPLVLKPRKGGGSADVFVVQDAEELRFHAERILQGAAKAIVQEYVGDPAGEFTVGVLHLPDGTLAGSFALRRDLSSLLSVRSRAPNRTGRSELGPQLVVSSGFSQGDVEDFPEVRAQAERVAAAVGSRGPLNVQGRLVDGELVVFEVNPRFSGTEAMRAMAGWNAAEALVEWHLGLPSSIAGFRPRPCAFVRTVVEHQLDRPGDPRVAAPRGVAHPA